MTAAAFTVSPDPTPEEAAAIAAAVEAALAGVRGAGPADPRPAAYRSRWRLAALAEGADDGMTDVWRSRV